MRRSVENLELAWSGLKFRLFSMRFVFAERGEEGYIYLHDVTRMRLIIVHKFHSTINISFTFNQPHQFQYHQIDA